MRHAGPQPADMRLLNPSRYEVCQQRPGSDAVRNGRGSVALRLPEGNLDEVAVAMDGRVQPDAHGRRVRRRLVRSR